MRLSLSLLFLLFFNPLSYGQIQRNYAQELFNLLTNGRYFEAKEFKMQHQDQLPPNDKLLDFIYNIHLSRAFNNSNRNITYLEELLGDSQCVRTIGSVVGQYYVGLCESYESKQQFEKAISTVERHINYLKENLYPLDPEGVKMEIHEAQLKIASLKEKLQHEPIRGIVRVKKINKVKLKDDPYIRFDAQYNGHSVETLFDTGVSYYCMMEKGLADQIGVKYKPKQDSIRLINGKPMRAIEGYIDCIEIKGIKLYNIPALVLIDKFTSNLASNFNPDYRKHIENNVLKTNQVLFGLPLMKMIGRFEFDWKSNMLTISQAKEQNSIKKSMNPNIAFNNGLLYLHMEINDIDFTGFLDLGADHYLFLTYPYFFKSNSAYVKNDPLKKPYFRTGLLGVQENIERYKVDNPNIHFDRRKIETAKPGREVYAMEGINNFDGEVGIRFFKNTFAKTVIDFNSMAIECED